MIIIFQKFEKKIKFYQKFFKAGDIKILITILLTLETMRQLIWKPSRTPRTTVRLGGGKQRGGGVGVIDEEGSSGGGGCLQPLRTALHTISISLENSLS